VRLGVTKPCQKISDLPNISCCYIFVFCFFETTKSINPHSAPPPNVIRSTHVRIVDRYAVRATHFVVVS
jgi:hypothetical protein